jgi:hypothetical protein
LSGADQDGQRLTANPGAWDGSKPITFFYQWQRCTSPGTSCHAITGAVFRTEPLDSADIGGTLRVVVTAKNSAGSARARSAASRVVAAMPPRNKVAPPVSGTPQDGQALTTNSGSWNGSKPISFTYQWQRCTSSGSSCQAIPGATLRSEPLDSTDVGATIRVAVTAGNSAGSATAYSAATRIVAGVPPDNTVGPSISGTPQDGQTLTTGPGSWGGTKPIGFAYQWQRCSSSGSSCQAIPGATLESEPLDSTDVGATIRVAVTAGNSAGSATAYSAATSSVVALPPDNSEAPLISGVAREGQVLTGAPGSWQGTIPLSFSFKWRRCATSGASCADIPDATSTSYTLTPADDGSTISLAVTASNAGGSVEADSRPTAAVIDPQPSFPIRAAFYYPWFPEAWNQQGLNPFTHYTPSLGFYDSSATDVIEQHIQSMEYGNIQAGIASWWGQGTPTDLRFPALLSATDSLGSSLRWAIYYEPEGQGDPTVSQITDDLNYIRDTYASDPAYLRINGRFVVFVYADPLDGCPMADRWQQANTVNAYVVLKVFPGYHNCISQPDGWHQYSPAVAESSQAGYSFSISPGFYKASESSPRLTRDLTRWNQNIQDMIASSAPFQLITTFNEWGEGTAVESAQEWATSSGYGAYLDALHNNGADP